MEHIIAMYKHSVYYSLFHMEGEPLLSQILLIAYTLFFTLGLIIGIYALLQYEFIPFCAKKLKLYQIPEGCFTSGFNGLLLLTASIFLIFRGLNIFYLPIVFMIIFLVTWLYRNLILEHD